MSIEIMKTHTVVGDTSSSPFLTCIDYSDRPARTTNAGMAGAIRTSWTGRRSRCCPDCGGCGLFRCDDNEAAVQHEPRQDSGAGVRRSGTLQRHTVRSDVRESVPGRRQGQSHRDHAGEPDDGDVLCEHRGRVSRHESFQLTQNGTPAQLSGR